ncbi:MAG: hypothetical protein RLZZ371_589 [Pseudomonadota bacterium]
MSFWKSRQASGIFLIILTALFFASLDTAAKRATQTVPLLMLLWFRYTFQALVTLALRFPVQKTGIFVTPNPRFQVLRGALLLVSSACAFFGLQYLPVAEFTAIGMLSPMAATAMAAWMLKTHVSRQRWALMCIGLLGVLLVVRPGGQVFNWGLVFPLGMVASYAWFQVLTSRLSADENPYTTHFYTGLIGSLLMTPFMLHSWDSDALLNYWYWFVLVGSLGTFAHLMLIRAFDRAKAVVLVPYLYTQIAFATLLGWIVFRHVPDGLAWAGIAVIAASGAGNAVLSSREVSAQRQ